MSHAGKKFNTQHDPKDPNPWQALFLDSSIPLNTQVKEAWLKDTSSASRQYLLPLVRPFARLIIILVQGLKIFLPKKWQASKTLHKLIVLGLKTFVSPEANWLVMRHFHIGSEIQKFIVANLPGIAIPDLHFMRFRSLDELRDNAFLYHDINLYNFVIWLNQALQDQQRQIVPPDKLDFSMISADSLPIDPMPTGPMNKIDLLTAIEVYTPVYQFFLTDSDFWRATNSLQLDETIAIYVSKILSDPLPLMLVNNKHPMIPLSTLRAGFRLVIHGLASEMLHAYLVKLKLDQEQNAA
jgi:hypothetical protein